MNKNQSPAINPEILKLLLYAIGGYILYNRFFGKDKEDREADAASAAVNQLPPANNPLQTETYRPKAAAASGMIYFRTDKTKPPVPKTYFVDAARDIKESFGIFNDDEARITRSMKKALTKAEVNLIARAYSALYKKDLFFELNSRLNKKELQPIYSYILALPEQMKGTK